ncbi:thiol reductant ABC exporter subunit CydC [Bacillus piscicola]|uniref:thiol reductant ABC exporter subunit CydC n=1 Tax=Bacillus piscicola TaxID=1632684 RepID=UPI001F099A96|nr:thiol reductant ABC exporter subunit CydC [Bacillus piscicola]
MNRWIIPYIHLYKGRMSLSVIYGLLGVTSGAMLLFVSGYLISKSSLRPENIMIVYVPIVAVRAFSIGQALFPYLQKLVSHDIVLRILSHYRQRLYDTLEPQAIFLQSRYQTGDILSILADDIEKLQDFYIRTLFPSIIGIVVYGVLAVVFGFFDLPFMLMMLAFLGIIVFLVPFLSYKTMRRKHLAIKKKRGSLYQHVTDAMFGKLDWMVSGRVQEIVHQVAEDNKNLITSENKMKLWHHKREAILRFTAGIAIILVMVWSDAQTGSSISPTIIAAFVLMMFSVADALLPISEAVEEIPLYTDSIKRMEAFEEKDSMADLPAVRENIIWDRPAIHLDHVTYSYNRSAPPVIDDLSLTIEPGKKVAVLGKSGTGKSTLLKLLSGVIQPATGKIHLNNTEMSSHYLSSAVSVLNQKPHIFHTTIANNVRIGKPDASEEEIIAVLEQAQVMRMIDQLPGGIHTQMDEMGGRFSGGERQRVAFARVLLQDTPILLMDEPTTGLDPRTEHDLLVTILEAAKDKTIIWVTHHLAGAKLMDDIIFMEAGKVKLRGPHRQLLKTNNYYKQLYQMDEGI